jgi:hypothetical protein
MARFRAGSDLSFVIKRLNALNTSFKKRYINDWITHNKNFIMGMLKVRLWTRGISGDGTKLKPYTPQYKKYKQSLGKRGSPTSLNLTGDWYNSMYVYVQTEQRNHIIEVRTHDNQDKTNSLKRKYGASIMTIDGVEQQIMIDRLQEDVNKSISEALGEEINLTFI